MIAFISDVHLGYFPREIDKQRENLLIELLFNLEKRCKKVYFVGDLFDYWFEYKTVIPKYFYRTLFAIEKLVSDGIEVSYLIGNHDFGHLITGLKKNKNYNFFINELGVNVYPDEHTFEYEKKKFYLYHGDGLFKWDYLYRCMKVILRNPFIIKLYSFIHPDCGITLARHSSSKSRQYSQKKSEKINIEGMEEFAFRKIEEGYDYVIMGHRHKAQRFEYKHGVYVNLGDWLNEEPTFAIYENGNLELKKVKEYLC